MVLIIGSLIFYAYADWHMLYFLVASVLCNYLFAYLMQYTKWRKVFLAVPIGINVVVLLFFKYINFIIENLNLLLKTKFALMELLLPLGISFITFQQIAYLVTVYRGECPKSGGLLCGSRVAPISAGYFKRKGRHHNLFWWQDCMRRISTGWRSVIGCDAERYLFILAGGAVVDGSHINYLVPVIPNLFFE